MVTDWVTSARPVHTFVNLFAWWGFYRGGGGWQNQSCPILEPQIDSIDFIIPSLLQLRSHAIWPQPIHFNRHTADMSQILQIPAVFKEELYTTVFRTGTGGCLGLWTHGAEETRVLHHTIYFRSTSKEGGVEEERLSLSHRETTI